MTMMMIRWSGQQMQKTRRRSPSLVLVVSRVSLCHRVLLFLNRLRRLHPILPPPPPPPPPLLPPHLKHNHSSNYNHPNEPRDPRNAHSTSRVLVRVLAIPTTDTSLKGGGISGRGGILGRGVMFSWLHHQPHTQTHQRMRIHRNFPPLGRLRLRLVKPRLCRGVRVLLGLHHRRRLLLTFFRYRRRNPSHGLYIPIP